jgi:hypothetical protein
VPVDDLEELGCVVEADLIEPAAAHGHRVMMQAHERVQVVCGAQRGVERRECFFGEVTARGAGQAAIEQHDAPAAHVDVPVGHERLAA